MIDGFSTDDIRQVAREAGATLVMQQPSSKFPGKGMEMKADVEAAIKAKVDSIIFLEGDIKIITHGWIDLLSEPVWTRAFDTARGYYDRHPREAPATKRIAPKPMLSIFSGAHEHGAGMERRGSIHELVIQSIHF